jgi:hypothetical protein
MLGGYIIAGLSAATISIVSDHNPGAKMFDALTLNVVAVPYVCPPKVNPSSVEFLNVTQSAWKNYWTS